MAGGNHKHQEIVDPDVTVILRWMDSAGSDGGCELTVDQRKLRTGEETPAPRSVDNGGLDDRCRRGGLARALTPATTPGCLGRRQIGGLRIDCSGWKAVEVGGWRGGLDRRGTVRCLCRSEKQERQRRRYGENSSQCGPTIPLSTPCLFFPRKIWPHIKIPVRGLAFRLKKHQFPVAGGALWHSLQFFDSNWDFPVKIFRLREAPWLAHA